MHYQVEIDIEQPRQRVLELFLDPQNLAHWQPELVSYEQIGEGDPNAVGARSRQVHKNGGQMVEMIQTITVNDYPDRFAATYEADGIWNLIDNRFLEEGEYKTRWRLDAQMECSGFVVRLMTIFMPGMFRKQTLSYMTNFKQFAEKS